MVTGYLTLDSVVCSGYHWFLVSEETSAPSTPRTIFIAYFMQHSVFRTERCVLPVSIVERRTVDGVQCSARSVGL